MYSYKILFSVLYLWALLYISSYIVMSVKSRKVYASVSAFSVCLISVILFIIYFISE